jgi:outer membrane protein assembly factor BamB
VVDAETGNVFLESTCGVIMAFSRDGKKLWERSMMEEYGRLTFPNGRTGSLVIEGNLVIADGITANWGADGPARNRFYAFDKTNRRTRLVLHSGHGTPRQFRFGAPVFADLGGHRVFYLGTGCGHVVCVNARTGEPVWRFKLSQSGVNSDMLLAGPDRLIAIHGKENVDATSQGRLVALRIPDRVSTGPKPVVLGKEAEIWRNDDFIAFSSSPLLVNGVYSTIATGSFQCADANHRQDALDRETRRRPDPRLARLCRRPLLRADARRQCFRPRSEERQARDRLDQQDGGRHRLPRRARPSTATRVLLFTKDALHCFGPKAKTPW